MIVALNAIHWCCVVVMVVLHSLSRSAIILRFVYSNRKWAVVRTSWDRKWNFPHTHVSPARRCQPIYDFMSNRRSFVIINKFVIKHFLMVSNHIPCGCVRRMCVGTACVDIDLFTIHLRLNQMEINHFLTYSLTFDFIRVSRARERIEDKRQWITQIRDLENRV